MCFADFVFAVVDVLSIFIGHRGGPVHARLIVIVNCSASIGVGHVQVCCSEFDVEEFFDAFVSSYNFCFKRALGSLFLAN